MIVSEINSERFIPEFLNERGVDPEAQFEYAAGQNSRGQACLMIFTGRRKKPAVYYAYPDFEKLRERLNYYRDQWGEIRDAKKKEAAARAAVARQPNRLVAGDVLCASWGFEQTNVDFYLVKETKGQRVTLAPVACKSVEATGWASDKVVPDVETVIGEPIVKTVYCGVGVKFTNYMLARPYDGVPKHRSWYA